MKFATLLLAAALFVPAAADAQDLAGKWTASYPQRVRMTNGVAEGQDLGTAILELEIKGDSIFGTWHAQNTPMPSTPRTIAGTIKDGKLSFVAEPMEARIRRSFNGGGDGEETPIKMVTYYEGTLKDGVIEGTYYSKTTDSSIETPPVKWTAKR